MGCEEDLGAARVRRVFNEYACRRLATATNLIHEEKGANAVRCTAACGARVILHARRDEHRNNRHGVCALHKARKFKMLIYEGASQNR